MFSWLRSLWRSADTSSGARGEQLAADWLTQRRGFRIVARNWRSPRDRRDEIDLVCRDGEVLVFVEVKARAAGSLVPGVHAVDARKKKVLRRAAQVFLAGLPEKPTTFRLDVVEIVLPAGPAAQASVRPGRTNVEPEILHFENIALFPKHFRG
jgi:putative endonuclease